MACGAVGVYAPLEGGEWGVDIGPVASMQFRKTTVGKLEGIGLVGLRPAKADKLIARERVRVAESLTRAAADTLVEAMGRKETRAEAVRGSRPKKGFGAALIGLPLLAIAGGVALGLAWSPIGYAIGAAVAAGVAAAGASRRQPLLGQLPLAPEIPHGGEGVARKLVAVAGALDAQDRETVMATGRAAFELLARLARPDDMAAMIAGGVEGGMGEVAVKIAREATRIAEARAASGLTSADTARLQRLAAGANEAIAKVDRMKAAEQVEAGPSVELELDEELELLTRTVEDIEYA